jgi:carbon monoxide dehydrogenase subunit G
MIVEGQHAFDAAPERVWPLLLDPEVIARAMPGARELVAAGDGRYTGRLVVTVGPIAAAEFALEILIEHADPPRGFEMAVNADGRFGFTRGRATVSLAPDGAGTRMAYRAELQVGGKIASLGQRLLEMVSRTMLRSGLTELGREVTRRLEEPA